MTTRQFDVFLSYNHEDRPIVQELARRLQSRELGVWLAEWELAPGQPFQEAIEEIVATTRSAAVLVGPSGIGPWQDREMRTCLSQFVRRRLPVIPVLLPGAAGGPTLPLFLAEMTWVDLREGLETQGLDRLQWGITGVRPSTVGSPENAS